MPLITSWVAGLALPQVALAPLVSVTVSALGVTSVMVSEVVSTMLTWMVSPSLTRLGLALRVLRLPTLATGAV